ncbi:MAG: LysM peptidoglycan-binding domain-containing protein [Epsilonproteobacteria bacterium]|nr:LysM peptidoglycan-binding domain-containing protein [Campylobacterota bacterium]
MRYLIFLIFTGVLYANIISDKNVEVLRSLDINGKFVYNKELLQKYKDYAKNKKEYFLNALENGYYLLPVIKDEILDSHIPKALLNVAMAESYLKLTAKSNKKAIGLWQFMPRTARIFGLRIDEYVDERKDPIKSTKAAIRYFEYLHDFFGKWYLAIMAYNAGEARIVEGITRAKIDKLCKRMGKKCRTSKKIGEYRWIIRNYQRKRKGSYRHVYKLYKKLKHISVDINDLLKEQTIIERQYIPRETKKYLLKILAMSFLLNRDDFINYSNSYILNSGITPNFVRVYVDKGTSLYYVSSILDVDYKTLRSHNLHLKYSFTPPYKYYIYIPYDKLLSFKLNYKPQKHEVYIYYVKKGDTLIKIAKKFNTRVRLIKDYNKLGRYLHIGQRLVIPLNTRFFKYVVKSGDTLGEIARKFDIDLKKLKEVNNIKNDIIIPGEIIKIPQRM